MNIGARRYCPTFEYLSRSPVICSFGTFNAAIHAAMHGSALSYPLQSSSCRLPKYAEGAPGNQERFCITGPLDAYVGSELCFQVDLGTSPFPRQGTLAVFRLKTLPCTQFAALQGPRAPASQLVLICTLYHGDKCGRSRGSPAPQAKKMGKAVFLFLEGGLDHTHHLRDLPGKPASALDLGADRDCTHRLRIFSTR
jgi:hypothetical protein